VWKIVQLSKTEQDYIKVIYELGQERTLKLISLKDLTSQLQVSAPSVTAMAKRLEKKELIEYQSYKGVRLTDLGNRQARFILKAHRVWECFLLDVLHYQEEDVHFEAEALEHAVSPQLIERLHAYLGKPGQCPHGRTIPQDVFWYEHKKEISLGELGQDVRAEIINTCEAFRGYLIKLGVKEEARFIKIDEKLSDGTYIARVNDTHQVVISPFFQQDVDVIIYH